MPVHWVAWLSLLMAVNMVAPLIFISTVEGKVVLAAAMFGAITQMAIFNSKGFVRLLGVGHVYWIPMNVWLWTRLGSASQDSLFGQWLLALIILNTLSLIIDVVDVTRYVRGERAPRIKLDN